MAAPSLHTFIAAAVICVTAPLASSSAAIFSIGPPNGFYGSSKCMEIAGPRFFDEGTPVQVWDCHAGPNQQFIFAGPNWAFEKTVLPGTSIYGLSGQRCVDIQGVNTAIGASVTSYSCNGGPNQQFNYINGQIVAYSNTHLSPPKCLEAPSFNNGTQLRLAACDIGSDNQQFHIK